MDLGAQAADVIVLVVIGGYVVQTVIAVHTEAHKKLESAYSGLGRGRRGTKHDQNIKNPDRERTVHVAECPRRERALAEY